MGNLPIEWIVGLVLLYGLSWFGEQVKRQRQSQTRPPEEGQASRIPDGDGRSVSGRDPSEGKRPASEVLPEDLWEEIEALARGERPRPPEPPAPVPPEPVGGREPDGREEESTWETGARATAPPIPIPPAPPPPIEAPQPAEPPVRVGSGALATRRGPARSPGLSARLASVEDRAITARVESPADRKRGTKASSWLVDASPEDLRRAVILHAVLGPPLAVSERDPLAE